MAGGGSDSQGRRGIPRHWPNGGGVEIGDGDPQFPLHPLHHLPQLPPWFSGGLLHRYCLLRGQTDTLFNGHEAGGLVRNISGPAQDV